MSALDDVIRKHAADLQRCYDERTAGDHSFTGALAMFLLEASPLIEERGAAKVRERVEQIALRPCNFHAAGQCAEDDDQCSDDETEAFADAAMWIRAAIEARP